MSNNHVHNNSLYFCYFDQYSKENFKEKPILNDKSMISQVKISLCHHIVIHLFLDDLDKNLKQFLVIYSYYLMICLAMSLLPYNFIGSF